MRAVAMHMLLNTCLTQRQDMGLLLVGQSKVHGGKFCTRSEYKRSIMTALVTVPETLPMGPVQCIKAQHLLSFAVLNGHTRLSACRMQSMLSQLPLPLHLCCA